MRRSIIPKSGGTKLSLNPCIIELAVVTVVFALSCAATLQMLAKASQRAQNEQILTRAVSSVQSLCETYSSGMELELAAAEVFKSAEMGTDEMSCIAAISSDGEQCDMENAAIIVTARETVQEQSRDGYAYGALYTLRVSAYADGECLLTAAASKYRPYAVITAEEDDHV